MTDILNHLRAGRINKVDIMTTGVNVTVGIHASRGRRPVRTGPTDFLVNLFLSLAFKYIFCQVLLSY